MLAARARLYLSHVGRSVRDNSSIPPSILVSELVEHLVNQKLGTDSPSDAGEEPPAEAETAPAPPASTGSE